MTTEHVPTVEEYWKSIIDANDTLEDWNKYVIPQMRDREPEFLMMAAAEAKRRHYIVERINCERTGRYIQGNPPLNLQLTKGRNIGRVDWQNGMLYVQFHSSPKVYEYPNVPEVWFHNLLRSPYPDNLFAGYKVKLEKKEAEAKNSPEV